MNYGIKKVAIVKNRIDKGGVLQVVISMIKTLNGLGVKPVVFTFSNKLSKQDIERNYGAHLDFEIREIFIDIKMPYEWHLVWFNVVSNFYVKGYDLVINTNNTSCLTRHSNVITYIHFPRKYRVFSNLKSIHDRRLGKKSLWDYKQDLFYLSRYLHRRYGSFLPTEKVLANSKFTKAAIKSVYDVRGKDIEVIYPSIQTNDMRGRVGKKNIVLSLGRFEPLKKQIKQIHLAKQLPGLEFYLCGFVQDKEYLNKCVKEVEALGLKNVNFFPDVSFSKLQSMFEIAEFFIHTTEKEPFGITVIEAVKYGCIPIVHNSGGTLETVPNEMCRFEDLESVLSKFQKLQQLEAVEKDTIVEQLQNNLLKFDEKNFIKAFEQQIKERL